MKRNAKITGVFCALCLLSACVPPRQSRPVNYPPAPAQTSGCDEELEAYCIFEAPDNDPQCAECR